MTIPLIIYDRVDILVNNVRYLPNGKIQSMRIDSRLGNNLVHGMTTTGYAAGVIFGNSEITFDWEELCPNVEEFINWQSFILVNPGVVIDVIPKSLSTFAPTPPQFVLTGIVPISMPISSPGEGQSIKRICTFKAITGLNNN